MSLALYLYSLCLCSLFPGALLGVAQTVPTTHPKNAYSNVLTIPTTKDSASQCATAKSDDKDCEVGGVNIYRLETDLIKSEGLRLKPYRDSVGKLTIGVGHNLDDEGITKEESMYLLQSDVVNVVKELWQIPEYKKIDGNDVRERVIAEMVFNLGFQRVLHFKKMWECIGREDWSGASQEMLNSKWSKQVGARATRLAERMRTGSE